MKVTTDAVQIFGGAATCATSRSSASCATPKEINQIFEGTKPDPAPGGRPSHAAGLEPWQTTKSSGKIVDLDSALAAVKDGMTLGIRRLDLPRPADGSGAG